MMRNYLKIICIVLCAVIIMPVLSACAKDGLSAYDIAVKNGFEGTEQEWLLSLKGADAPDMSDAFARAVNRGLLSAVSITTYAEFGDDETTTSQRKGVGSGFFYSIDKENGSAYIVTNFHVVYNKDARFPVLRQIHVSFYGLEESGYSVPATYVGGSATFDIAVLKIENCDQLKTGPWQVAPVRSSADIMLGETVFAVGDAKMLGISTAVGTVTQETLQKKIPRADENGEVDMRLFRVDAPINSGTSGGAVFDRNANVIGVVVAKNSDASVEGIGYIIPSDIALRVAGSLIDGYEKNGSDKLNKCLLGVTVIAKDPFVYVDEGTGAVRTKEKVVVTEVSPNSAAQGKIFPDDIIIAIESANERVEARRSYQLVDFMLSVRVGDVIKVEIERDGVLQTVEIAFSEANLSEIP